MVEDTALPSLTTAINHKDPGHEAQVTVISWVYARSGRIKSVGHVAGNGKQTLYVYGYNVLCE